MTYRTRSKGERTYVVSVVSINWQPLMESLHTAEVTALRTEPEATREQISALWDAHDSTEIDGVWDTAKRRMDKVVRAFVTLQQGDDPDEFENDLAQSPHVRRALDDAYERLEREVSLEAYVMLEAAGYEVSEVIELDDDESL
ncbi:hypothetical protein [Mycobacterium marinum]|uniref:hypothetical protein n=1 Tax=Mycobacterium marinum TaxID=1781 RepID=UPI0021C403CF|nr:hypothetical protein [Mycobacterium marinum]